MADQPVTHDQEMSDDAAWVLAQLQGRVAAHKIVLRQKAAREDYVPLQAPSREEISRALRHREYLVKHGILMPTDQPADAIVDADGSGSGSSTRAQLVRKIHDEELLEKRHESLRRQHEGLAGPEEDRWIATDDVDAWFVKTFGPSCQDAGEVGLGCPGNPPHTATCRQRSRRAR
jgi:hypothetical protein